MIDKLFLVVVIIAVTLAVFFLIIPEVNWHNDILRFITALLGIFAVYKVLTK